MYRSDWHIHSTASYDASLPLEELFASAARQGITEFGVSDHVNRPSWLGYLEKSRALWESHPHPGFHLGVELTTISGYEETYDRLHGSLDGYDAPPGTHPVALPLTMEELSACGVEYVIGAAHWALTPSQLREDIIQDFHRQQMMLAADPRVDIVGHPWWMVMEWQTPEGHRGRFDDFDQVPQWMREEFVQALLTHDKAMEINVLSFIKTESFPEKLCRQYMEFARWAFESGVRMTIGSDEHGPLYGDYQEISEAFLKPVGFRPEDFSTPKFRSSK